MKVISQEMVAGDAENFVLMDTNHLVLEMSDGHGGGMRFTLQDDGDGKLQVKMISETGLGRLAIVPQTSNKVALEESR